jgi:hypothetical protein
VLLLRPVHCFKMERGKVVDYTGTHVCTIHDYTAGLFCTVCTTTCTCSSQVRKVHVSAVNSEQVSAVTGYRVNI